MKIGFIGLGVMGRPMAERLLDAGHELYVHRIKPVSRFLVDKGATALDRPQAVAEAADVIILMVPDTPDVEAVLFGEGGIVEGLGEGKLIIDMSSISPVATKSFAEMIGKLGCGYVDAPVSGGEVGAQDGALTIMAGGAEKDYDRALPLFEIMGKNISRVGDVGDGQTAKVANQIIVALTIQAVAEALLFAKRAGADPAKVREALMGGFASSRILELHGERMIKRTFDPGFRINLHRKDINLALDAARQLGIALPNTASVSQMMNAATGQGDGDRDHSGLLRTLEILANGNTEETTASPKAQ